MTTPAFLLTSAKDTFLKLWDLSTRHCVQTVVAHRAEIWSLDINPDGDVIFTGSGEGELKAWKIDHEAIKSGLKESEDGEVGGSFLKVVLFQTLGLQVSKMILPLSSLPLSSRHRVSQISFHPTQAYMAVQSHDRSVEIFRVRTDEELKKKLARRKKRAKEKQTKDKLQDVQLDEDNDENADNSIELVDRFIPYLVVRASGKIRSFDFATVENDNKRGVNVGSCVVLGWLY